MGKKKKGNRAEEARRGTRADPARAEERRIREEERERQAAAIAAAEASGRPIWYMDALDKDDLPDRERVNRTIFIVVEVVLAVFSAVTIFWSVTGFEGFSAESFQSFLYDSTYDYIDVAQACLQIVSIIILVSCYRRYLNGDVGAATYSFLVILCAEVGLVCWTGVVGVAVLLFRMRDRCSTGVSDWQIYSDFKRKVLDLAPSVVVFVLALILYFVETGF